MFPSGVARPFATIVRYQDVYELGVLEPGQSIADSLTLLRGQEGALFPSAGIFQIIVNVSWVEDGIPAMVSGETMVLITQPVSEEHAKAAKLIRGEEIDNPVRKEMAEVLLSKAGQLDMTDDIQTILAKHKVWQGGLFPAATNISVERVPSCYQFSHYNIEPEKGTMIRFSGGWKKTTEDKRAVKYPRFLEYRDSGLYSARSDENGIHPVWDAGTWEIVAPYRLNRLFRGRPTPF